MALPDLPYAALAHFKTLTGSPAVEFDVHFNPESLEYTLSNTFKNEGGGRKKQFIDDTTAKLTMKLVFDTTDTGGDVRIYTESVAALLKPVPRGNKRVPPNVEFTWGAYRFTGMVEQHKETLDFFAETGVPLRATVDLTLVKQDFQFDSSVNAPAAVDQNLQSEAVVVPAVSGPTGVANALGDPRLARVIGAANGSASLRFGSGASLAIGGNVELKAEAAFSAGASAGIAGGIGIGGGMGLSAGNSLEVGGGAGIDGVAVSGINGAAGGAFAGLRASPGTSLSVQNGQSLLGASVSRGPVQDGVDIGIGGQAQLEGSAGLSADVGADADLSSLIGTG